MKNLLAAIMIGLIIFCANASAQSSRAGDEKAIEALMWQMGQTWETGDMAGLANLLTDNAVHVSPFGEVTTGREEVRRLMQWVRDVALAKAKIKMTIAQYALNFAGADNAIVTFKVVSEITGQPKPKEDLLTVSVQRVSKQWKIAHFQGVAVSEPPIKRS